MKFVHGEASHHLATPELDLDVTLRGGHLAPVVFHLPGRDVSPYSLSPWQPEEFPEIPALLSVLRGDFLCLPFGAQADGPPHGEVANFVWTKTDSDDRSLRFVMVTADSGASVEKIISTREGEHAVYQEHRISGLEGDFSYGNHPILDLSGLPEGTARVSVSPFRWASVFPGAFSNPADGETQALKEGARFSDLREVPLADGGTTDLTRYPARPGNDDLVMMMSEAATAEQPFAWAAVVFDGYVWFSLKNAADFPCTLFWMSHGGRTAAPWNGRHVGRIGVEEVCSYFASGVAVSRRTPLAAEAVPTSRRFHLGETISLRTIHAVALVARDFGMVVKIVPAGDGAVTISGESGAEVTVAVDWRFLL
ncbi:MAG: hypothetical protein ABIT37_13315 [Luteolibacter sp.]